MKNGKWNRALVLDSHGKDVTIWVYGHFHSNQLKLNYLKKRNKTKNELSGMRARAHSNTRITDTDTRHIAHSEWFAVFFAAFRSDRNSRRFPVRYWIVCKLRWAVLVWYVTDWIRSSNRTRLIFCSFGTSQASRLSSIWFDGAPIRLRFYYNQYHSYYGFFRPAALTNPRSNWLSNYLLIKIDGTKRFPKKKKNWNCSPVGSCSSDCIMTASPLSVRCRAYTLSPDTCFEKTLSWVRSIEISFD